MTSDTRDTVDQQCYGYIDFITRTEILSEMTFHHEILEGCHFKILGKSISHGDNYHDNLQYTRTSYSWSTMLGTYKFYD